MRDLERSVSTGRKSCESHLAINWDDEKKSRQRSQMIMFDASHPAETHRTHANPPIQAKAWPKNKDWKSTNYLKMTPFHAKILIRERFIFCNINTSLNMTSAQKTLTSSLVWHHQANSRWVSGTHVDSMASGTRHKCCRWLNSHINTLKLTIQQIGNYLQ